MTSSASPDPFDALLALEDQYHNEGYAQGRTDGLSAGRIEGRSAGLKAGFEKFLEAGRMQGKAIVWANRIPALRQQQSKKQDAEARSEQGGEEGEGIKMEGRGATRLPDFRSGSGARLEKNVTALYALVEPGTVDTENSDEAVDDFDDRVKRARGKLRVIERQVG